jgi:hypothetical protein
MRVLHNLSGSINGWRAHVPGRNRTAYVHNESTEDSRTLPEERETGNDFLKRLLTP